MDGCRVGEGGDGGEGGRGEKLLSPQPSTPRRAGGSEDGCLASCPREQSDLVFPWLWCQLGLDPTGECILPRPPQLRVDQLVVPRKEEVLGMCESAEGLASLLCPVFPVFGISL